MNTVSLINSFLREGSLGEIDAESIFPSLSKNGVERSPHPKKIRRFKPLTVNRFFCAMPSDNIQLIETEKLEPGDCILFQNCWGFPDMPPLEWVEVAEIDISTGCSRLHLRDRDNHTVVRYFNNDKLWTREVK